MINEFKSKKTISTIGILVGVLLFTGFLTRSNVNVAQAQTIDQSMIAQLQAQINLLQLQLQALLGGSAAMPNFVSNLTLGSRGIEVQNLQRFLNRDADTRVAIVGAGSVGAETQYFGSLTRSAVMRFQTKYAAQVLMPLGLTNATGFWGASSRTMANSILALLPPTPVPPPPTPPPTGALLLRVSLADTDTSLKAIPRNVTSANFGNFNLVAENGDVAISSIEVSRSGLGSRNDFESVWLTLDGQRITDDRSILSNDRATFSFSSPLVVARGSHRLAIMGSLASNVSSSQFNTLGIASISASTNISGTLPVFGPQTVTSAQLASEVTLTSQGSNQSIRVGTNSAEIGRFRLSVNSASDRAVVIERIRFENDGRLRNMEESLENVRLTASGSSVSSTATISDENDTILFDLGANGLRVGDGQSLSFVVLADVQSAEVNDTINLSLERASEIEGREEGTNTGIRVLGVDAASNSTNPASNVELATYSLLTGQVNLSVNNSSSKSVAQGSNDVVLLDGILRVDSPARVDGFRVRLGSQTLVGANTVASINALTNNVTLKISGISVQSASSLTNASGGATSETIATGATGDYLDFRSNFILESGSHPVLVEADMSLSATSGSKIQLQMFSSDIQSPRYTGTGNNVPSSELTGTALGSLTTILSPVVTLNRNDGLGSESIVGGARDEVLMRFTMNANSSSQTRVSSMTVRKDSGTSMSASDVTNVRLFVDGNQKGSAVDLSNGAFTSLNFDIPASGQVQAELRADIGTVSSGQTLAIQIVSVDAFDALGSNATVNTSNGSAISTSNSLQSATFTVGTSGQFQLTIDGNTPREDIIVADGGGVWYPIATYRLSAQDEDLKLTDLYLVNATSSTDVTDITTSADARIQTLGLFDENGVLKGSRTLTSGAVHFDLGTTENSSGQGAIRVPRNGTSRLTVKVRLNNITTARDTGALIRLALDTTRGTGNSGVEVQSISSGSDLGATSIVASRDASGVMRATSTASDYFAIRKTKPALSNVAQAGSETNLISTNNVAVLRFNVSASSNEDVLWKGIKFDLRGRFGGNALDRTTTGSAASSTPSNNLGFSTSASSGNLTNFRLYEQNGAEVRNQNYAIHVDWDATNGNGEVAVVMNDLQEEIVSAGTSKTYELRADISGVSQSGDFVNITVDAEANNKRTGSYLVRGTDPEEVDGSADGEMSMTANTATTPYVFLWADNSGSPHSSANDTSTEATRDWTNDRFLKMGSISWNKSSTF